MRDSHPPWQPSAPTLSQSLNNTSTNWPISQQSTSSSTSTSTSSSYLDRRPTNENGDSERPWAITESEKRSRDNETREEEMKRKAKEFRKFFGPNHPTKESIRSIWGTENDNSMSYSEDHGLKQEKEEEEEDEGEEVGDEMEMERSSSVSALPSPTAGRVAFNGTFLRNGAMEEEQKKDEAQSDLDNAGGDTEDTETMISSLRLRRLSLPLLSIHSSLPPTHHQSGDDKSAEEDKDEFEADGGEEGEIIWDPTPEFVPTPSPPSSQVYRELLEEVKKKEKEKVVEVDKEILRMTTDEEEDEQGEIETIDFGAPLEQERRLVVTMEKEVKVKMESGEEKKEEEEEEQVDFGDEDPVEAYNKLITAAKSIPFQKPLPKPPSRPISSILPPHLLTTKTLSATYLASNSSAFSPSSDLYSNSHFPTTKEKDKGKGKGKATSASVKYTNLSGREIGNDDLIGVGVGVGAGVEGSTTTDESSSSMTITQPTTYQKTVDTTFFNLRHPHPPPQRQHQYQYQGNETSMEVEEEGEGESSHPSLASTHMSIVELEVLSLPDVEGLPESFQGPEEEGEEKRGRRKRSGDMTEREEVEVAEGNRKVSPKRARPTPQKSNKTPLRLSQTKTIPLSTLASTNTTPTIQQQLSPETTRAPSSTVQASVSPVQEEKEEKGKEGFRFDFGLEGEGEEEEEGGGGEMEVEGDGMMIDVGEEEGDPVEKLMERLRTEYFGVKEGVAEEEEIELEGAQTLRRFGRDMRVQIF